MALGARLYLVTPDAPAGEIGLILLTLGVLQLYEIAVSVILLVLHRFRRSPEDLPSLMLVAALFWTGPLAATVEMTARHGGVGLGFAAAAAILALCEMTAIQRELKLAFSRSTQILATGCLLLIAFLPAQLRAPFEEGRTDELALYAAWWVLAGIAWLALPLIRRPACAPDRPFVEPGLARPRAELGFVAVVLLVAAFQLYAMNYAFFAHARAFYLAPVLAVAGLLLANIATGLRNELHDPLLRATWRRSRVFLLVAGLAAPLAGIALSLEKFDPKFPVFALPVGLNDPLVTSALLAALVWWSVARHFRASGVLLHAGSAALALAACRLAVPLLAEQDQTWTGAPELSADWTLGITRKLAMGALFAVSVYLFIIAWLRRNFIEYFAALAALLSAVFLAVWRQTPHDELIVALVAGWTCLLAACVRRGGPAMRIIAWPVALLVVTACLFDFDDAARLPARLHAVAMPVMLIAAGWICRQPQLRMSGYGAAAAGLTFGLGRAIAGGSNTEAGVIVLCAFAMLTGGAALSWHKRRLLRVETQDA
jgi:hypothetical protein